MQLRGSQTEKNLEEGFTRESSSRSAYVFFSELAKKEGQTEIADVFTEIAHSEEEYARKQFALLERYQDTASNLASAVQYAHSYGTDTYTSFAATARVEGFAKAANFFDEMVDVKARQESICQDALDRLREKKPLGARTVGHSSVTLTVVMLPHQANNAGYAHGGELMKLMDTAAGVVAFRHCRTAVVTARADDLSFHRPVKVGDLVLVHARMIFVSRRSMDIEVRLETEDLRTGERQGALTAHFVYVSLDAAGNTVDVPPLLITTEEGKRRYEEGRQRYQEDKARRALVTNLKDEERDHVSIQNQPLK